MTAPLTPPDCDLRDFLFMPLDVSRVMDSDLFALTTGDEFKAAIALWCKSWAQVPSASLPNDDRVLAHLSGAGGKWKKVKAMALRGFVLCDDGRLYHPVVAEKAMEAWGKRVSYRERSKKGNEKRWASNKDGGDDSKSDPTAIPKGLLELPKGQGEGQGENPLAKANDAGASDDKVFWARAVAFMGGDSKRSLIGKWCKEYGQPETAKAITAAQSANAVDPVSYVTGALRKQAKEAEADHAAPIC